MAAEKVAKDCVDRGLKTVDVNVKGPGQAVNQHYVLSLPLVSKSKQLLMLHRSTQRMPSTKTPKRLRR